MNQLHQLLQQTKYDKQNTKYLVEGFTKGFDIGYRGPYNRKDTADNLPFRIGSKIELWNIKEVQEGRYAGPFKAPPGEHYVQSPLGLVPKAGNKMRLIFHLSYDFGTKFEQRSINFHTPESLCSVKYNDLDHAIKNSLKVLQLMSGREHQPIFFAKSDCSNAFRIAPVLPEQHLILSMKAIHPITGKNLVFRGEVLTFRIE